jgi:esterase/lipase superfamily enzyme
MPQLKERYYKWYSPILGKEMEMLTFGDKGYPVIVFPTSMGSYTQNRDFKLIESAAWFIENGLVKIYTPASIDSESWYAGHLPPAVRAYNHTLYDRFVMEEVVNRACADTGHERVALAGCSFGAYHATNFAFRHPEKAGYLFNMGGAFDIKPRVNGYYDDNVYFNNPPDYLPGLEHPLLHKMGIVFGTGDRDMCLQENIRMSEILSRKGIAHWLDIRKDAHHDWPVWREMFPHYLSLIKFN